MLYPEDEEQFFQNLTSHDPSGKKRQKIIDDKFFHRLQRRHFILFDVLPFIGTIVAIALMFYVPIGAVEISLFLIMWILSGLGISIGYHRFFAHRSYDAVPWVVNALAIFGSMAGQGPLTSWVAIHRRHHEFVDREGDLHSPNLSGDGIVGTIRGLVHSHLTWMIAHPYPNVVHYAPDLLREKNLRFISRHYNTWVALGFIVPALLCAQLTQSWWGLVSGALWGGCVRMFVLEHGIWSLNSICHKFGRREYKTKDESRNNAWLAPFTFGEAWHHNHHAFAYSASFGLSKYRIDPGFWAIILLAAIGLASNVKIPTEKQLCVRSLDSAA